MQRLWSGRENWRPDPMARLGKNYTIKQDGTGKITIEKKPFHGLDASAKLRMQKSKKVTVKRRGFVAK